MGAAGRTNGDRPVLRDTLAARLSDLLAAGSLSTGLVPFVYRSLFRLSEAKKLLGYHVLRVDFIVASVHRCPRWKSTGRECWKQEKTCRIASAGLDTCRFALLDRRLNLGPFNGPGSGPGSPTGRSRTNPPWPSLRLASSRFERLRGSGIGDQRADLIERCLLSLGRTHSHWLITGGMQT